MNEDTQSGAGAWGALRLIGALAVVLLALVALGVVFDIIPRDVLADLLTRIVLMIVIVVAAAGALLVLLRR